MLYNYLKVGIRNILKYKVFSFINIFGLAVAMSVCMLIILMLADQKSYDQFHTKKDRIYRVLSELQNESQPHASTPFPLASTLKTDYPIIEETTHLVRGVGGDANYKGKTAEMIGFFADPTFFDVFSYPLEKGNKSKALASPNTMIITSALAQKLFNEEDPVGKTVQFVDRGLHYLKSGKDTPPIDWGLYTITGVIDSKKHKSHLKFDVLISASSMQALSQAKKIGDLTDNWENFSKCFTYALLIPGKNSPDLSVSLHDVVKRKYAGYKDFKGFKLIGQKLTEITPGISVNQPTSISLPIEAYYFLSFLALVIMLSACLNYTNLATARALTRAKEIGVRKVNGAQRKDLVYQFLSESIITAMCALLLAIGLLIIIKPAFMSLWVNSYLNFDLQSTISVYIIFAGFALMIGIVAGLYPAFYLSKLQPVKVLKTIEGVRPGKLGMRKVLSVFQFVISLFFIITSILIYNQFKHFLRFEYGFNTRNIVNVPLQGNEYQKVANELRSVPGVSVISASEYVPAVAGGGNATVGIKAAGNEEAYKNFRSLVVDENFVNNLDLKLIVGRNLPATGESSDRFVLVNETAVQELGYKNPSQVLGQQLVMEGDTGGVEVIGVVQNFHFRMLLDHDKIDPLVVQNQPAKFKYANVQLTTTDLMATIAKLEDKWEQVDAVHGFKYEFYDDQLATTQQVFVDAVSILGFLAFLAITIACLGMLGMATYTAERRMKEVGIRKVLGAADFSIALLLSKGFLSILILSICIGVPVSYLVNNLWLQNFPNRVDFGFGTLLLGSLILLVLGILTIGSQTIRAAKSKPIDTLRND